MFEFKFCISILIILILIILLYICKKYNKELFSCDTVDMIKYTEIAGDNTPPFKYKQPKRVGEDCSKPVKLSNSFKDDPDNIDPGAYISQTYKKNIPSNTGNSDFDNENNNYLKICPLYDDIVISNLTCKELNTDVAIPIKIISDPNTKQPITDSNGCYTIEQSGECISKNETILNKNVGRDTDPLEPISIPCYSVGSGIDCTFDASGPFGKETINIKRDPYEQYGYNADSIDWHGTLASNTKTLVNGASNYLTARGVNIRNPIDLQDIFMPTEIKKRERATYVYIGDKIDNNYNEPSYLDSWKNLCNVNETTPSTKYPFSPCCPKSLVNGSCYCENGGIDERCPKDYMDSWGALCNSKSTLNSKTGKPCCLVNNISGSCYCEDGGGDERCPLNYKDNWSGDTPNCNSGSGLNPSKPGYLDCCPQNYFGDAGCYCLNGPLDPRCPGGPPPGPLTPGGICKVDGYRGYKGGYTDDNTLMCCEKEASYIGGSLVPHNHNWYCSHLNIGDKCVYDWQCESNNCNNNTCVQPPPPSEGMYCNDNNDAWNTIYGYTDDNNLKCCTAQYIPEQLNNKHDWYCINSNKNDNCIYDWQCKSNSCKNNVCQ